LLGYGLIKGSKFGLDEAERAQLRERGACFDQPPKTFLRIALPVATGSRRIFFSSSPIMKYRPSSALPVT
jgi:hypothetical protein